MSADDDEIRRIRGVYASYNYGRGQLWNIEAPAMAAIESERDAAIDRLLAEHGNGRLAELTILDVGCGSGFDLRRLVAGGASPSRLHGIDILSERLAVARRGDTPLNVLSASAGHVPFRDETFDVLMLCTVLSSILSEPMRLQLAAEVRRVLRPGGIVLWYDLRWSNPQNRHVRGVGGGRVRSYFPGFDVQLSSITVAPPLVRAFGRHAGLVYPLLKHLPPLRSHLIGLLVKPTPEE